jgi:hypothetical protein
VLATVFGRGSNNFGLKGVTLKRAYRIQGVRTSAADPGEIPSLEIDANVSPSGSNCVEVGANLTPPEIGANLNSCERLTMKREV